MTMMKYLGAALVLLCGCLFHAADAGAPPAVDAESKPYIGTWSGKEDPKLGLPAPMLKIRKDATGAYFLGNSEKPLYEFTWAMGEDQLQAKVTDGKRFFAAVLRPDGKLVWRAAKLPPGTKTNGIEYEKVPSDF